MTGYGPPGKLSAMQAATNKLPMMIAPARLSGGCRTDDAPTPLKDAKWYIAQALNAAVTYSCEPGALAGALYLWADLLLDGDELAVFELSLRQGQRGPTFRFHFSLLNQCSARLRMPMEAVNQNRWSFGREGACLKMMAAGSRVDPAKVDRLGIKLIRMGDKPVRWCMTPLHATADEPPRMKDIVLPRGPVLDELGQCAFRQWPTRTANEAELVTRLKGQLASADKHRWPGDFARYGGCKDHRLNPSGFFRTQHDGKRWWLVDPEGCIFWSAGLDCVGPNIDSACEGLETALKWRPPDEKKWAQANMGRPGRGKAVNYLVANFIRAFGQGWRDAWGKIAIGELRRLGFNTVGNWSEWKVAAAAGFPYVRPLSPSFKKTPLVYRDFPDVFHPSFAEDAAEFSRQLAQTKDDPALIGYFLMNEPTWGFSSECPAAGMLYTTTSNHCRDALAKSLRDRYGTDAALANAWGMDVSFAALAEGRWTTPLSPAATKDLEQFSTEMATRLFGGLTEACRKVDPNHLNLGARYYIVPPAWLLSSMGCFDVFSINSYSERVPADKLAAASKALNRPVMIGEWHFGALDVGLPASGIGRVIDQAARGQAYRIYLEDAAAQPWCVGVHYFTMYDQSALGRFDGENYNIGFLDTCNRVYEPLAAAAIESHKRLYAVARGEAKPYADAPKYLPKLF